MFTMTVEQRLKQDFINAYQKSLNIQPNEVVVEYVEFPDKEGKFAYFMDWLDDSTESGVRGQIFRDKGECITQFKEKGFTIREIDKRRR